MNNRIAHVVAFPTETSEGYLWEVNCIDCKESIGTMHSQTLQKAIVATVNRGGIKCPSCRGNSCDVCGENVLLSRGELPTMYDVGVWPKPMRLCYFCVTEFAQQDLPVIVNETATNQAQQQSQELLQ